MVLLLLCLVLVGAAVWHTRENQQLTSKWEREMQAGQAQDLIRFAWSRSIQLFGALACFMIVLAFYEWQISSARSTAAESNAAREKAEAQVAELNNQLQSMQNVQPQAQQAPIARPAYVPPAGIGLTTPPRQHQFIAPPAKPFVNPYAPQTVPAAPATANPANAQPAPTQPPVAAAKPTVADVYNPEEKNSDNQSEIDALKKRYENILVTYMFLKRCNKITGDDYPVITSALGQEMASINAPGRLQSDILTSAQGSYNEIYSHSSCTDGGIDALAQQYSAYVKAIGSHLPAVTP